MGLALGSITVAGVSYADDNGGDAVYGWLMAALGLGALVGGTVYGARQWGGAPERRLRGLVALLAVCYLPLVLVPGPVAMTALTALAGVFLAPVSPAPSSSSTGTRRVEPSPRRSPGL